MSTYCLTLFIFSKRWFCPTSPNQSITVSHQHSVEIQPLAHIVADFCQRCAADGSRRVQCHTLTTGASGDVLRLPPSLPHCPTLTQPAPSSVSRHQVVSRQSAGVQMCPPATLPLLRLAHLSQGVFITHSVGPGISVGTTHPDCVMDPPAGCLVIRRRGIRGSPSSLVLLPAFFSFLFSSFRLLRVLHISLSSVLYLFFFPPNHPNPLPRNISQRGCGSARGPKLRLRRMSHYPSRWRANVSADIKVFQLIIIRGIHRRRAVAEL